MTGHNNGYGYRYCILGDCHPYAILEDNEVGALDAPRAIPAGAHTTASYWTGPMYLVARRKDGRNSQIVFAEWRF